MPSTPGAALSDEQLLHADFANHTLVVPRHEPGYQQLETFVYLSDVTPETAATRMVSRRLTAGIPVERTYLNPAEYADLYAAEVPASGPAGSVLAYRPDVYHRGVRMTAPGAARFMLHVSYKPASTDWLGSFGLPNAGEDMSWHRFVPTGHRAPADRAGLPRARSSLLDGADAGGGRRPLPTARSLALAGGPARHRPASPA